MKGLRSRLIARRLEDGWLSRASARGYIICLSQSTAFDVAGEFGITSHMTEHSGEYRTYYPCAVVQRRARKVGGRSEKQAT